MVWLSLPESPRLAPEAFPLALLLKGLAAVFALETLASFVLIHLPLSHMTALGALRCLQTGLLLALLHHAHTGWHIVGLGRRTWAIGWRWGLVGAALFAVLASGGGLVLHLLGFNPLSMIRMPLPAAATERTLFFIVGGAIAPIAEEVLFRGFIYTYCRRWGILSALILSTVVFAALHLPSGLPLIQIVGGIAFALTYEASGSLIAPILIHSLGNLAIFTLSLVSM
jgi:membrane protease YdiL (CAAX protease family)